MISTVLGTAVAGAGEEGIEELRSILREQYASGSATSWVYGDRLPAPAAALLNAVMARALDYCDGMEPGLHLGTSVIPAALAAAEHKGNVSGEEFVAAVAVGTEFGADSTSKKRSSMDSIRPEWLRRLRLRQRQDAYSGVHTNRCGALSAWPSTGRAEVFRTTSTVRLR
ncbi:hypothetical protein NJ76_23835 [Rhodococcus sp. IITR03]|nr:hypothetical protein NJ76_23835 [Rhodococcus sp. IITR03]